MAIRVNPPARQAGRARRAVAVILSLLIPGAGHFLLGRFRRGIAWAVGLTAVGFGLLYSVPVGLGPLVGAAAVLALGRAAVAIDTVKLVAIRPSWTAVGVAWAGLLLFPGW